MGKLVYIMGKSGTGKSRSMKNISAKEFALINPEGKDLPFGKNAPAFGVESVFTDRADEIVKEVEKFGKKYNIIVVDDFQTVMTNEYMRRSAEMGYQKWTDIAKHAWEIAEVAKGLRDDCIVYILCHTEQDENGNEKIKTLGKLLDQNIVLESKSTIVLKTGVEDGRYFFCTQNNGKDTVKSPEDMFPTYAIENDLKYVDDKIRNYYALNGSLSDEEVAAVDEKKAIAEVEKSTGGRRARKSRDEEKPARKSRVKSEENEAPWSEKLTEKTYFYIESDDNYVARNEGEEAPEGGTVITEDEFKAGVKRIAEEQFEKETGVPTDEVKVTRTRRTRRTRA